MAEARKNIFWVTHFLQIPVFNFRLFATISVAPKEHTVNTGGEDLLYLLISCPSIDLLHRDESGNDVIDLSQESNITKYTLFDPKKVAKKVTKKSPKKPAKKVVKKPAAKKTKAKK